MGLLIWGLLLAFKQDYSLYSYVRNQFLVYLCFHGCIGEKPQLSVYVCFRACIVLHLRVRKPPLCGATEEWNALRHHRVFYLWPQQSHIWPHREITLCMFTIFTFCFSLEGGRWCLMPFCPESQGCHWFPFPITSFFCLVPLLFLSCHFSASGPFSCLFHENSLKIFHEGIGFFTWFLLSR